MASRQKSFFDQDKKARPSQRRDWKPDNSSRGPKPSPRPSSTMAPIAASSQSKSKLRAFQYDEQNRYTAPEVASREKENEDPKLNATPPKMDPPPQPLSQRSATKEIRDCPQTPLGRLPLTELLTSGDDTSRQHLSMTPIERVLWGDNSPVRSQKKGRKRAHSSSPASSSQNDTSCHLASNKPQVDLQALQKALKTPKADPAEDLWSRYSLNKSTADRRSPTAPTSLPFTQLVHSSSPQTPASHLQSKDGVGLRRALSCIEWPTSAAKRRRLQRSGAFEDSNGRLATFQGSTDINAESRISRVSFLVEKIHNGLTKPPVTEEYSSSEPARSSPVMRKVNESAGRIAPPSQEGQTAIDDVVTILSQTAVAPKERTVLPLVLSAEEIADLEKADGSSDFADDDLDLEMFETMDSTLKAYPLADQDTASPKRSGGQYRIDRANTIVSPKKHLREKPPPGPAEAMSGNDERLSQVSFPSEISSDAAPPKRDEFDEDDDEVSAADLETMFAQYDTQPQQQSGGGQNLHAKVTHTDPENGVPKESTFGPKPVITTHVEVLSEDEDFGDDSDFEQIAAECAEVTQNQQVSQPQSSHGRTIPTIQRYLIKAVADSEYQISSGLMQPEKVLSVQSETTKLSKAIILRQAWVDTPCLPNSYVHLIGEFDRLGQCVVDNMHNLLILHPDHLISATVIGDSFTCTRKAVLEARVKATSDANQATLYGHLLHEIFQGALKANKWDDDFMASLIEAIATRSLESLFELQIELPIAIEQLRARAVDLQAWAAIYVAAKPKSNAIVKDRNGGQSLMCVNKLLEVEEKVWSPLYGLKGNIDATVQVMLNDGEDEKTLTVPFELKTGRNANASHKAQTSLYTLLLSNRYGGSLRTLHENTTQLIPVPADVEIACGMLYYMQNSEISSIPTIRHELVPMIMQRNELATYVRHREELPPMIKRPHTCGKCFAKTPCFLYHRLIEDGNGETSGLGEKFDEFVKHLNPNHQTFFSKWDALLTKEERDVVKFRRELWTMQSSEREKAGRCFSNIAIDPGSFRQVDGAPKINRYRYTFVKQNPTPAFSFTESQITLGEPIVISDEKGHFALANGYVTSVRKHKVEVTVDRRLHNARAKGSEFDAQRNQTFAGIMEVVENGVKQSTVTPTQPDETLLYRLDKDEFSNGMAMIRNNLIRLMEKDVFGVQALRRLIVENVAPIFKDTASAYNLEDSASQASLNIDQKAAIEKVMSAKDYALVLGMPGTGKTTTIAHIIRALVAQGKSVLLTSYTHTAVDNILLKLRNDGIGIFRLGAVAKVHPDVQEFADLAGNPIKTIEGLKRCYTQPIVATTCLGINHAIFNQRVFDYCIVDEASQITLPVCIGPIRMARTFILVGDHYQLPPLVQNQEAQEGGLDVSLFKMLSDNHPSSVINLEHQYRMCEDIMTLSNTLIYNGRLKCGTPAVANRSIVIPNMDALRIHHHNPLSILSADPKQVCLGPTRGSCWLRDLLDPSVKACFVNTDSLLPLSREVLENGSRITNPCEAKITTQLVESLITTGVAPTDIGVITLYRSQLALIKSSLRHHSAVEMHTADKFQGRDKEVVVLSLVRSNEEQNVGELLKDWRRVNVALTRARTKLVVLGSKSTLIGNDLLRDFVALMEGKSWWYDLPLGANEAHVFEDAQTQISGKGSADIKAEVNKGKPKMMAARQALGEGKENKLGRKIPAKQARLDINALMGKRPVLRDIVNDAS